MTLYCGVVNTHPTTSGKHQPDHTGKHQPDHAGKHQPDHAGKHNPTMLVNTTRPWVVNIARPLTEREVLWLVCEGNSYKDISQKLYISIITVKANMGRVYVKLGLDQIQKAERIQAIHQVYWPLLENAELPPEAPQAETPIPVPEPVAQMVDNDEQSIIPYRPGPADIIDVRIPKPVKQKDPRNNIWKRLLLFLFLILGAIACAAVAYFAFLQNRDQTQLGLELTKAVAQLTQVAEARANQPDQPSSQPIIEPAAPQVIVVTATNQPEPATPPASPAPTFTTVPTLTIAPVIQLPFSDTFDNSPNSAWRVLTGNWITADGRYSVAINEDYDTWLLTILDEPTWKNYRIKVDVDNPPIQLNYFGVFVRSSGGAEYLGFVIDHLSKTAWSMVKPNSFHPEPIAGFGEVNSSSKFVLDIEVSGNQYIGRINGAESQRISISGFDNGGIALGMFCDSSRCPSFDDFQIEALP
jgi:hypothetical protein